MAAQPFDLSQLWKPFAQAGAQAGANRLFGLQPGGIQLGGLRIPNQLAGLGLGLTGAALDKEQGEVQEARQSVRNLLTPESQTGQFTAHVKGLESQFQPLLTQQRQRGIEDISQRFAAAFPTRVGAQGPEFGTISRYITDEALPGEQAFLGQLGQQGITNQLNAGRTLLETARPDPFAQALSGFGGLLALRDMYGGQGGGVNQLGAGGGGQTLNMGFNPSTGQFEFVGDAAGQLAPQLAAQLLPRGPGGPVAVDLLSQLVASGPGQSFLYTSPTGVTAVVSPGEAALLQAQGIGTIAPVGDSAFALSGVGGALGALGAGVGGFFAGQQLGGRLGASQDSQALGAGTGALSGAAAGAAIGSVVPGIGTATGAVIGAVAGVVGGFGETRKQQHAQKAEFRTQDVDSQKDQVLEIGNVGAELLSRAGVDQNVMNGFASFVNTAETHVGSTNAQGEVASEMNRLLTSAGFPPGQRPPEWRQYWIDYLTRSTTTSGNSSYGGGAPKNFITGEVPGWLDLAQLKHGGYARRPTLALVGEGGRPEMAFLQPGSFVLPIGRN